MPKRVSIAEVVKARLDRSSEHASAEVAVAAAEQPDRAVDAAFAEVPIAAVAPNLRNVRTDPGDLAELTDSVREVGVLEPLIVRPIAAQERSDDAYPPDTRYVLVMGERRWRASQAAGRTTVPVVVRSIAMSDERQLMLIENLQRADLDPIDEARTYRDLVADGFSQRQLAKQVGKNQSHISRRLDLLRLPDSIQQGIRAGQLGVDVAVHELSRLAAADQEAVATRMAAEESRRGSSAWTGEGLRRLVAEVERASHQRRVEAQNRAEAESAGAELVSAEELRDRLGRETHEHRLYHRDEIAAAAADGRLLAVPTPLTQGPDYYTTGPRPSPAATPPSPSTNVAGADPRELQQRLVTETGRWAETAPTPGKTELLDLLVDQIVESLPRDRALLVHRWLLSRDADGITPDFRSWKASLPSLPARERRVVAWLAVAAHDLAGARLSSESAAGRRVRNRVEGLAS